MIFQAPPYHAAAAAQPLTEANWHPPLQPKEYAGIQSFILCWPWRLLIYKSLPLYPIFVDKTKKKQKKRSCYAHELARVQCLHTACYSCTHLILLSHNASTAAAEIDSNTPQGFVRDVTPSPYRKSPSPVWQPINLAH